MCKKDSIKLINFNNNSKFYAQTKLLTFLKVRKYSYLEDFFNKN